MAEGLLPWLPHWLHRLGRNRFDSVAKLARIARPTLFAHGEPDPVVPTAQGRALFAAAHEPKRLLIYPGAGHNVAGMCGTPYLDTLADFIRAALTKQHNLDGAAVETARCLP
jgi:fermentation-respiration switch protein FrsA (DUF1100 family)